MLTYFGGTFDYDVKAKRLVEVSRELELPMFGMSRACTALGKERSDLEVVVNTIVELESVVKTSKV